MNIQCVLCHICISEPSNRYICTHNTKTGTVAIRLLSNYTVELSIDKSYICKSCLRLLKKWKGLKEQLADTEMKIGFNRLSNPSKKRSISCSGELLTFEPQALLHSTPSKRVISSHVQSESVGITDARTQLSTESPNVTSKTKDVLISLPQHTPSASSRQQLGVKVSDINLSTHIYRYLYVYHQSFLNHITIYKQAIKSIFFFPRSK